MGIDYAARTVIGFELKPSELVKEVPDCMSMSCEQGHLQPNSEHLFCGICGYKFQQQFKIVPSESFLKYAQSCHYEDPILLFQQWTNRDCSSFNFLRFHDTDPLLTNDRDNPVTSVLGYLLIDVDSHGGQNEVSMQEIFNKSEKLTSLASKLNFTDRSVKLYTCLYIF